MAMFDDQATAAAPEPSAARQTLDLDELGAKPIRVAVSPLPTVLALLDVARGRGNAVPGRWARAARDAVSVEDLRALDAMVVRPYGFVPDCLVRLPDAGTADPQGELERIAAVEGEALVDALTAPGGPGIIGPWREVARAPGAWIDRYARVLERIWRAIRDEWTAASALVDREAERVGAALARGAIAVAVAGLHPGGSVRDGVWTLPAETQRAARVPERGLVLVPKLSGRRSPAIRVHRGDALTHLAYPLPGATRALGETPCHSPLEAPLAGSPA